MRVERLVNMIKSSPSPLKNDFIHHKLFFLLSEKKKIRKRIFLLENVWKKTCSDYPVQQLRLKILLLSLYDKNK